MASECVPPDRFWKLNREIAEQLWQRCDGATVSTRIAEQLSEATRVSVPTAKTTFHSIASLAVCVVVAKVTGSLLIGAMAALGSFVYLEQDRC